MLVKAAGALTPVMNLCIFNTLVAIIYFSFGRSLFRDVQDNFRYNYGSMSRGYMLLLTVMTGDGWSTYMYETMSIFCTGDLPTDTCDNFYVVVTALFYMGWFFYGQFLFITMFLAIILEAFTVEEFMTQAVAEDDEVFLTQPESITRIAEFQMVPEWNVSSGLVKVAWAKLGTGGLTISENKLITLVRMVQPKTVWRFIKVTGIVDLRLFLRKTIFPCFAKSFLRPYPGDEDFVRDDAPEVVHEKTNDAAELEVASKMARLIRDCMTKLVVSGLTGEVLAIAATKGILKHLDPRDLPGTEGFIALKILRHEAISKRLQLNGIFEQMIQDVIMGDLENTSNPATKNAREYEGLDLSKFDDKTADIRKSDFERFQQRLSVACFTLVHTPLFEFVMFGTILVSSAFLCLETPHPSIPGVISNGVLRFADFVFNSIFSVEFFAKCMAFGFYTPRSTEYMSYMQVFQNQVRMRIHVCVLVYKSDLLRTRALACAQAFSLCLSAILSICLTICLSICLSDLIYICIHKCTRVCMRVCACMRLSLALSVGVFVCACVLLCVCIKNSTNVC